MKELKILLVCLILLLLFIIAVPITIEFLDIIFVNLLHCPFNLFNPIRRMGVRVFGNRETMWVAITGAITALGIFIGLIISEVKRQEDKENLRKGLKGGLKHELTNNFNTIFHPTTSIKPERSFYYELKRNYEEIKDHNGWRDLIVVYKGTEEYEHAIEDANKTQLQFEKIKLGLALMGFISERINILTAEDIQKLNFIEDQFTSRTNIKSLPNLLFEIYVSKRDKIFTFLYSYVEEMIR